MVTSEQLEELKREVASTVRVVVNGKIDDLSKKVEYNNRITEGVVQQVSGLGSDLKAFKLEMLPVQEGLHTIQSLNRFVKWLGLPALGALIAYWFMK
jgi:hypothetical protein